LVAAEAGAVMASAARAQVASVRATRGVLSIRAMYPR
jgi:hypothetical protein